MIAYTGTIIRRAGTQSGGIMHHYCLFYGFVGKIAYVLHNDKYGAECIAFADYMENIKSWEIVDRNPDNSNTEKILERAKERCRKMFHLKLNNCEHFVYYAAYGVAYSSQSEITNLAQNLILWAYGLPIYLSGDEALINRYNKFKRNIAKPTTIKHYKQDTNNKMLNS